MADILLSEAEKTYILHGVQKNFRRCGRQRSDYRTIELESNIVPQTMGSSRLRLANTDVVVSVKTEIDTPYPEQPEEGKIEFSVNCSGIGIPQFEGRGGENLATEIVNSLTRAYKSSRAFNLSNLCIVKNRKCWKLCVDILIFECGGNLWDTVSLAVKAALYNTRIPAVRTAELDGGDIELDLSDDPFECRRLDVANVPIMVTLCKIGEYCIVDPTAHEEECSTSSLIVSISGEGNGRFSSILKRGASSFRLQTLKESLKLGLASALELDAALNEALKREESLNLKEPVGYF